MILRIFSFLFFLPLTLFFLGIGAFALAERAYNLNFPMLPWTGRELTWWIFGLSLAGLFSILLALAKRVRPLYAVYAIVVFGLAVYAVFLSGHRFDGINEFGWGLGFCLAALLAAWGAIAHALGRRT
ncbi:MAG TPA: hypothetical protein VM120_01445 [Bryobacteraceae bacterium]|nr:hypothetical protein [Bryobacteraceae bacterium]